MNPWILVLSHFFHVMGTVVWIGGIFMTLLVILPGVKAVLESQPIIGTLMNEVAKRFTPLANISILLLVVTGIIIFYDDKSFTSLMDLRNWWNVVIVLKHFFIAIMIMIHFYRGLILNPKIARIAPQSNEKRTSSLKKLSLDLVKVNLILGIMVLAFTALAISWSA